MCRSFVCSLDGVEPTGVVIPLSGVLQDVILLTNVPVALSQSNPNFHIASKLMTLDEHIPALAVLITKTETKREGGVRYSFLQRRGKRERERKRDQSRITHLEAVRRGLSKNQAQVPGLLERGPYPAHQLRAQVSLQGGHAVPDVGHRGWAAAADARQARQQLPPVAHHRCVAVSQLQGGKADLIEATMRA